MDELWRVEFHVHTCYSPDCLVSPHEIVRQAQALGLDRVCIVDHNSIRGALEAKALAPDLVVVGEEILTTAGELIAFFVREEIPKGLDPLDVIERLRKQNAVIGIPHPFDTTRKSAMGPDNARRFAPLVDAVEIYNARCLTERCNTLAEQLAQTYYLGKFGGSDAHSLGELGRVLTHIPPFKDADGLRAALQHTYIVGRRSPHWVHLISTGSKWVKKLGLTSCP